MKDKLRESIERLKEWLEQDKKKSKRIAIIAAAVIVIAVIIAVILNNQPYEVLFTGLTTDEASAVVGKLDEYGATEYKIENDRILVPKDEEANLKARLLLDGYPKSGFGYETYLGNVGMMATESDRDTLSLYQLQDRMAAVIRCFEGVKDARVTITPGEDRRYVLDSSNVVNAEASVSVSMRDGGALPENYATAIRTLVARSVKGLEFGNIGIVDSLGNTFEGDNATGVSSAASDLKLRLENQINNRIRGEVLQALSAVYGAENIRVSVHSTVDVSRRVQESTTYQSPEGAPEGEGIIGSREYDQELVRDADEAVGGVVGTQDNSDINTYMNNAGAVQGNENYIRNAGSEEFDVNSVREQAELNSGTVTDVSIAVTINQDAADTTVPQLTAHIARAAGIQPEVQNDKISVWVAPFYDSDSAMTPTLPNGIQLPDWAIYVIAGGVGLLLFLILLLVILARRRKKNRRLAEELLAQGEATELMANAQVAAKPDVLEIQNEKSMELKQEIRKFTQNNPEIAAQMLKMWLKGEAKDG